MDPDKVSIITALALMIAVGAIAITAGWVINTWLRIKNGYPLENQWGKAVYPKTDLEAAERIKLLTNENAELRAELGSIKDRLGNVEKIVVDDTHRLSAEIEALNSPAN